MLASLKASFNIIYFNFVPLILFHFAKHIRVKRFQVNADASSDSLICRDLGCEFAFKPLVGGDLFETVAEVWIWH